jgi:hypothetical protein
MNSNTYICHENIKHKRLEANYCGSPNVGVLSAGLLEIETEYSDNDVLTAAVVIVKVTVFCDVTPCSFLCRI